MDCNIAHVCHLQPNIRAIHCSSIVCCYNALRLLTWNVICSVYRMYIAALITVRWQVQNGNGTVAIYVCKKSKASLGPILYDCWFIVRESTRNVLDFLFASVNRLKWWRWNSVYQRHGKVFDTRKSRVSAPVSVDGLITRHQSRDMRLIDFSITTLVDEHLPGSR